MAEDKPTAAEKKAEEKQNFLKEAEEIAARNEKAVGEMKALLERNENLEARKILGGKSDAGEQPPVKVEETPREYAKRIMTGGSIAVKPK